MGEHVDVDPARQFGQPCVGGTRIPTRAVADFVYAGIPVEEACEMWGLDRRAVLTALWYEARHGTRRTKKAWGEWGKEAGLMLWHSEGELPEAPPSRSTDSGRLDRGK